MGSALLYEYRRAVTLRTTWIFLLIAFAMGGLTTWAQYYISGADNGVGSYNIGLLLTRVTSIYQLTVFVIASFAALSWGHEYRFGLNRLTLSVFPRRWTVFIAKTVGIIVFSSAAWLTSAIGGALLLFSVDSKHVVDYSLGVVNSTENIGDGRDPKLVMEHIVAWHWLGRSLAFVVVFSLIVGAVTALTRNLTIALIVPNVMMLFAENVFVLVGNFASAATANVMNQVLPFVNGQRFADWSTGSAQGQTASASVPTMQSMTVYLSWAVLLLIGAGISFQRRDA